MRSRGLDGKAAGIVQTVDEGADRVDVMRFDMIDQLVGDRFRVSASNGGAISYSGVLWHGQPNPNWSTYVQAWLTEKAGRTVYAAKGTVPVPRVHASSRWKCCPGIMSR